MNKEDLTHGVHISEQVAKTESEFIHQVLAFANYQQKEIEGTKKSLFIIALDGDTNLGRNVGADCLSAIRAIGDLNSLFLLIEQLIISGHDMGEFLQRAVVLGEYVKMNMQNDSTNNNNNNGK